jgi:hypothetical protein
MTCFLCCADSDILPACKRCILWHGICYRDKMGVETNWRYVGKAVGLRANLCSHLHARCYPRDCSVQTSQPKQDDSQICRHFTHRTDLTMYKEKLLLIREVLFHVRNSASYSRSRTFKPRLRSRLSWLRFIMIFP